MKAFKPILYFLLSLLLGFTLNAQSPQPSSNAYTTAIDLAHSFNQNNSQAFYSVLFEELNLHGQNRSLEQLKSKLRLRNNMILLAYVELCEKRDLNNSFINSEPLIAGFSLASGKSPSNVSLPLPGGFNWIKIADGISKFIVGRMKDEVILQFYKRLIRDFNNETWLQLLFPTTFQLTKVVDQQGSSGILINVLREAFTKDLDGLPQQLPKLGESREVLDWLDKKTALQTMIGSAAALSFLYDNKEHPEEILTKLPQLPLFKNSKNTSYKQGINILSAVSEGLKSPFDAEAVWLNYKQWAGLEAVQSAPILWLGLIYATNPELLNSWELKLDGHPMEYELRRMLNDLPGIAQNERVFFKDLMSQYSVRHTKGAPYTVLNDSTSYSLYYLIKPLCSQFIKQSESLQKEWKKLDSRSKDRRLQFDELDTYVRSFISIVDLGLSFSSGKGVHAVSPWIGTMNSLLDLRVAIQTKDYYLGWVFLNSIIESSLPESWDGKASLLKYGLLFANVTAAENADQVQYAIESVALPAGSSSRMANTKFEIGLQAFAGVYLGQEDILLEQIDASLESGLSKPVLGLSAPLGLNLRYGIPNSGSLSVFFPLLDVGALVSFRFNDPETELLPVFTWQNLLSPGAYLVYSFKGFPLSIGGGIQYGPQLRKIILDGNTFEASSYRTGIFIAVDIPVLRFYHKSR